MHLHRGAAMTLEGRAVLASYDPAADMLTVWSSTQTPHLCRGTLGRSVRAQPRIDPGDRAAGRRRLRHQGAVLSGGGGDPGRGDEARPPGEMAGGPPRAFPRLDPGARPVLEGRHRGRRRRQDPRPARHHAARHRRLSAVGHHRAVHRLDDVSRALCRAGLQDRKHRRADQPRADHGGARRRPAAGGVRHGAADGPRRPRTEDRPRRIARPQHHPARADALFAGPDLPRRQADGLCQRRFPEEPAPRHRAFEIRQLPRAAEPRPAPRAAISASASATTSKAPASARSRASPSASCRTARSRSRPARRRKARAPAPRCRRSSPTISAAASRTS